MHSGSKLLIHELPSILDGSAERKAQPQDDSKVTKPLLQRYVPTRHDFHLIKRHMSYTISFCRDTIKGVYGSHSKELENFNKAVLSSESI